MDNARAQELVANERARLERLLRAEIGATAPDQGDDVDDANWRIAEERLEADPLAELLVEEAAVEAFRARRSTETVSGLTSTRRTLAALADREENADDSRGSATSPQTEEPEGEEDVQSPEDSEDLDVEELEDGELIDEDDDEEAPAEFEDEAEHAQDAEDEEPQEAQEEQAAEEEEERPPQRRRSGR